MATTSPSKRRQYRIIGVTLMTAAAIGLVIVGIIVGIPWLFPAEGEGADDDLAGRTFDGDSGGLEHTVIVPTLDTPIPLGKSAIWCSSIQIAWNRFKSEVTKGPVQLENAEAVANRLNRAPQSEDDLVPDSYYAAAGMVKDGIVSKIRSEMSGKFPRVAVPDFNAPPDGAVMYGYLRAKVRFTHHYHDNPDGLTFTDSAGRQTSVRSFGVPESKKNSSTKMLDQVRLLFRERGEFALDLCTTSWPNTIVVARLSRKESLAATWDDLQSRATKAQKAGRGGTVGSTSTILVPNLTWRVEHHFQELEGEDKRLRNPGLPSLYLARAVQMVQFKLDRTGASVETSFRNEWLNGDPPPDQFWFDGPFLIAMKKRGATHPFFVMWVDNAELLSKL